MPVICSRSTWFMSSMRSCIRRNVGIIRKMMLPMLMTRMGIATARIHVSSTSSRMAITRPPTAVSGAPISRVQVM